MQGIFCIDGHMIIRPFIPSDLEQCIVVHQASRRASEEGIIFDSDLDRQSLDDFREKWMEWTADNDLTILVAESEKDIAGFTLYGRIKTRPSFDKGVVPRFGAEIYALYVHPDHFRKGIGRALFYKAVEDLVAMKLTSMILWALKKNQRATAFYDSLNGEKIAKQRVDFGEKSWAEESCFGWRDIRKLIK